MKKLFLAASILIGLSASAQEANTAPAALKPVKSESHDFGKIKQNVPVTTVFELKNVSNAPVVIESATAGCGCTTPEYKKEPIPAGGVTKLKVGYNAAAPGPFNKEVYVKLAGSPNYVVLLITGEVVTN